MLRAVLRSAIPPILTNTSTMEKEKEEKRKVKEAWPNSRDEDSDLLCTYKIKWYVTSQSGIPDSRWKNFLKRCSENRVASTVE